MHSGLPVAPRLLNLFDKDMLHRGAEVLVGLSSVPRGFVNIIEAEASVESRVRQALIAGSLLNVGFLAILLLLEKLLTCPLDLLFFDIL